MNVLQYMYDFMEAAIMRQTAQEEAYRKLDEMAAKLTETLRKSAKMVSDWLDVGFQCWAIAVGRYVPEGV